MEADDRRAFAAHLAQLSECFNEPVSAARAEAYFAAMSDLSLDVVGESMACAMRECRFFPRPAELRAFVVVPEPTLGGHDILGRITAILQKTLLRMPPLEEFDAFVMRALGGAQRVMHMDASLLAFLVDKHGAEWIAQARARDLRLPAPGELPSPKKALALPPPKTPDERSPADWVRAITASLADAKAMPQDDEYATREKLRAQAEALKSPPRPEMSLDERIARKHALRDQAKNLGVDRVEGES